MSNYKYKTLKQRVGDKFVYIVYGEDNDVVLEYKEQNINDSNENNKGEYK